MNPGTGFPLAHRHLLIASILEFVSSPAFAKYLHENGHEVSSKTASNWQQAMREWLGLPSAGRGKLSAEYRNTVKKWRQANGNPTLDEIDGGWVPAHRRRRDLSPAVKEHIEEFRQILASLDEVGYNDGVEQRLAELMKTFPKTVSSEIEDLGTDGAPPSPDLDRTDEAPPPHELDRTDEVPPSQDLDRTDEISPPQDLDRTDEVPPPQNLNRTDEVPPSPELAPDGATPT